MNESYQEAAHDTEHLNRLHLVNRLGLIMCAPVRLESKSQLGLWVYGDAWGHHKTSLRTIYLILKLFDWTFNKNIWFCGCCI